MVNLTVESGFGAQNRVPEGERDVRMRDIRTRTRAYRSEKYFLKKTKKSLDTEVFREYTAIV